MNRTQHYSLLKAMEIDKNNLLKYQELYKYAYILSDGIFKVVFAEDVPREKILPQDPESFRGN